MVAGGGVVEVEAFTPMAHAAETLERAEHIGHAGHHDGPADQLPVRIGITMAILGVLLAFSAAKVGGERTELVQALVGQQHAHAKYQAQDIKHRSAVLSLRQLRATAAGAKVDARDMLLIAASVDRYKGEAEAASKWVEAYDPVIDAHTEGQEEYEQAQLAAEFGIVVASIALLIRKRALWLVAVLLGVGAIGLLAKTYVHEHKTIGEEDRKIEEAGKAYRELRLAGKSDDVDRLLVDEVKATFGEKPAAPTAP
jgi:hypothetical protein